MHTTIEKIIETDKIKINANIERINDWDSTISRINELNISIIDKIAEISQNYHYDTTVLNMDRPETELFKEGIDSVWMNNVYGKILKRFMDIKDEKNEDPDGFLKNYLEFQGLVWERIQIGKKVAEYKMKKGLDTHRPDREKEILEKVRDYGVGEGLDPTTVYVSFGEIMDINKQVQRCYRSMHSMDRTNNDDFTVVDSVSTQCPHILCPIDSVNKKDFDPKKHKFTMIDMGYRAESLTEKTGLIHSLKSFYENDNGREVYTVKVVNEHIPKD